MITPDPDAQEESTEANQPRVALQSLAIDGEPPAINDEVEVRAKLRVTSLDGDKACFEVIEVNGEPITHAVAPAELSADDVMEAAMKDDAAR